MNILFLGYYSNDDGYKAVFDIFNNLCNITFFPLMHYYHNDKNNLLNDLFDYIMNNDINIIIVFHNINTINALSNYFEKLLYFKEDKNINIKIININWDPSLDNYNDHKYEKYFDLIFVSNPKLITSNKHYTFYAGYNPSMSYYYYDKDYICDVVFVGTNLYTELFWENQNLNRMVILDEISKNNLINLHVYSPENNIIYERYKKNHKGFIKYKDCYKVFSNALFSLNISPLNNIEYNNKYYFSERLGQILACNSIMISNNSYGNLLVPNEDYIYIDDITKLNDIIIEYKNNPEKCEIIKNNYKKKLNVFNYEYIISDIYNIIKNK